MSSSVSPRRAVLREITEREVTVEMRRHDKEALEFDVTHCRFAEFFRALGEPELGALLVCATDFDIVTAGGSEVRLTREQTLMQGAACCDFRYELVEDVAEDVVEVPGTKEDVGRRS